jgi:hypothetical protein
MAQKLMASAILVKWKSNKKTALPTVSTCEIVSASTKPAASGKAQLYPCAFEQETEINLLFSKGGNV